jgi:hypothetical protein
MLGRQSWPLIRSRCLVHDKYYRLPGVHTVALTDAQSHFGAGHQNLVAVLAEFERLGIPRVLYRIRALPKSQVNLVCYGKAHFCGVRHIPAPKTRLG